MPAAVPLLLDLPRRKAASSGGAGCFEAHQWRGEKPASFALVVNQLRGGAGPGHGEVIVVG